jgi:hypothetical protein
MSIYFTINTLAELICAAIGCYCLVGKKDKTLQLLWGFVLLTCLVEMYGIHIKKIDHERNAWLYNHFLLLQLTFYSIIFYQILKRYINPIPLLGAGILLVVSLFGYQAYTHDPTLRYGWAQLAFSITMSGYCLYYFYLLLAKDDFIELKTYWAFWWVAGTLFYFFAVSVVNIYSEPLQRLLTSQGENLSLVYKTLNIILYSCWSYAFICKRWEIQK